VEMAQKGRDRNRSRVRVRSKLEAIFGMCEWSRFY
jgi:hypothetical protein